MMDDIVGSRVTAMITEAHGLSLGQGASLAPLTVLNQDNLH